MKRKAAYQSLSVDKSDPLVPFYSNQVVTVRQQQPYEEHVSPNRRLINRAPLTERARMKMMIDQQQIIVERNALERELTRVYAEKDLLYKVMLVLQNDPTIEKRIKFLDKRFQNEMARMQDVIGAQKLELAEFRARYPQREDPLQPYLETMTPQVLNRLKQRMTKQEDRDNSQISPSAGVEDKPMFQDHTISSLNKNNLNKSWVAQKQNSNEVLHKSIVIDNNSKVSNRRYRPKNYETLSSNGSQILLENNASSLVRNNRNASQTDIEKAYLGSNRKKKSLPHQPSNEFLNLEPDIKRSVKLNLVTRGQQSPEVTARKSQSVQMEDAQIQNNRVRDSKPLSIDCWSQTVFVVSKVPTLDNWCQTDRKEDQGLMKVDLETNENHLEGNQGASLVSQSGRQSTQQVNPTQSTNQAVQSKPVSAKGQTRPNTSVDKENPSNQEPPRNSTQAKGVRVRTPVKKEINHQKHSQPIHSQLEPPPTPKQQSQPNISTKQPIQPQLTIQQRNSQSQETQPEPTNEDFKFVAAKSEDVQQKSHVSIKNEDLSGDKVITSKTQPKEARTQPKGQTQSSQILPQTQQTDQQPKPKLEQAQSQPIQSYRQTQYQVEQALSEKKEQSMKEQIQTQQARTHVQTSARNDTQIQSKAESTHVQQQGSKDHQSTGQPSAQKNAQDRQTNSSSQANVPAAPLKQLVDTASQSIVEVADKSTEASAVMIEADAQTTFSFNQVISRASPTDPNTSIDMSKIVDGSLLNNRDMFFLDQKAVIVYQDDLPPEEKSTGVTAFLANVKALKESNQELNRRVFDQQGLMQKKDDTILELLSDVRHQNPAYEKQKIQRFMLVLSDAKEAPRELKPKQCVTIYYTEQSIHLVQFPQTGLLQSSITEPLLITDLPISRTTFDIEVEVQVTSLLMFFDAKCRVHKVVIEYSNNQSSTFTDFSSKADSKWIEGKVPVGDAKFMHFYTVQHSFFHKTQLMVALGRTQSMVVYPILDAVSKPDDEDPKSQIILSAKDERLIDQPVIAPEAPKVVVDVHQETAVRPSIKWMEDATVSFVFFSDRDMAERFENLQEIFVIKTMLVFADEFGVFGLQGFYMISEGEWFMAQRHIPLPPGYLPTSHRSAKQEGRQSIEPVKSIQEAVKKFEDNEQLFLKEIIYYRSPQTKIILALRLVYFDQKGFSLSEDYGLAIIQESKYDQYTISVKPNFYMKGQYVPTQDADYPSDYMITSLDLEFLQ